MVLWRLHALQQGVQGRGERGVGLGGRARTIEAAQAQAKRGVGLVGQDLAERWAGGGVRIDHGHDPLRQAVLRQGGVPAAVGGPIGAFLSFSRAASS